MIGDKTVYNEKVSCLPGKGGGTPETPPVTPSTTPAATPPTGTLPRSLPLTGGSGWLAALIASGLAAVAMIASTAVRSLFAKSL